MVGVTVEFTPGGCALLTMRNGQNKFNLPTLKQINKALDEVERNDNCKVLVTTGEDRFYSTGIDIDWVMNHSQDHEEFHTLLLDTMWRFMYFPMPTVAAINGHAFAGGGFLAVCHDYRVMNSNRGWITWNETLLNLPIPEPMVEILQLKLTTKAIRESTVFARRIAAAEAKELGIVDSVETMDNLISAATTLGFNALGKNDIKRNSLQVIKKCMYPRKATTVSRGNMPFLSKI